MPDISQFNLADVLTIVGASAAAGLVTGIVELLKAIKPIGPFIKARELEQTIALGLAAALVVGAVVDSGMTGPNAILLGVLAWVWIGKGATAFYDTVRSAVARG